MPLFPHPTLRWPLKTNAHLATATKMKARGTGAKGEMDEASPDLTVPWGDHPKDRLSLFIRELRPRPDQLFQSYIL